jgi:hypothetical protein
VHDKQLEGTDCVFGRIAGDGRACGVSNAQPLAKSGAIQVGLRLRLSPTPCNQKKV